MSLMSLGVISLCLRQKADAFDEFGAAFDEFVALEKELRDDLISLCVCKKRG